MPYITCPHCGTSCFSVARHSTREVCPVCGGELGVLRSVSRLVEPAGRRFCHACGSTLEPDAEVVHVLGSPVHASCAVYRARRSA